MTGHCRPPFRSLSGLCRLGTAGLLMFVLPGMPRRHQREARRELACPRCRIRIDDVADLRIPLTSNGKPPHISSVVAVGEGYLVSLWNDPTGRVLEYDHSGILRRSFFLGGKAGIPVHMPLFANERGLYAIDLERGGIWDVATSDSIRRFHQFAEARSFHDLIRLRDGDIIVAAALRVRGASGQPLHTFDSTWKRIRSFGLERPQFRSDRAVLLWRWVTLCRRSAADHESFWVSDHLTHQLEKWTPGTAAPEVLLDSRPSWFQPVAGSIETASLQGDFARVLSIDCDDDARLWILSGVPDSLHSRGIAQSKTHADTNGDRPAATPDNLDQTFDTIVEVADGASGRVLATRRVDQALVLRIGNGLFGALQSSSDRTVVVRVQRLRWSP